MTTADAEKLLYLLKVPSLTAHPGPQFIEEAGFSNKAKPSSVGPFVYGFIDLFSGLEDSRNWSVNLDEKLCFQEFCMRSQTRV